MFAGRHAWVVLLDFYCVQFVTKMCNIICYVFIEAAKTSLIYNVKFRVIYAFHAAVIC